MLSSADNRTCTNFRNFQTERSLHTCIERLTSANTISRSEFDIFFLFDKQKRLRYIITCSVFNDCRQEYVGLECKPKTISGSAAVFLFFSK